MSAFPLFNDPTPADFTEAVANGPDFNGPAYDRSQDGARLTGQILRVFNLMKDGQWRTLREIETLLGTERNPASSVSAQLRHLRKPRFGAFTVEKRHRGERSAGLWEYKLVVGTEQPA